MLQLAGAAVVGAAAVAAIAHLRATNRRLRASDERFREIGETIDDVFWLIDARTGAIEYVSPAYARIWGRSADDLYRDPRAWLTAIHPDDLPRVEEAFGRIVEAGRFHEEYRVVRPDGALRWVRDRGRAVRTEDGAVVRLAGLAADVTDGRRVGEELRASERLYRAIVESTDEGIWCIDAEGITTFVNPAMAAMLGWRPEAMAGRSLFEFLDAEAAAAAARGLDRRRSGVRERHDVEFRRKDGTPLHARVTASPLYDDAGRYVGSVGVVVDRTAEREAAAQRRRMEERLREAQEMESLGALAGGVAHDFNNLLVAIVGNASLAHARLEPGSTLRPVLADIERAGARAAALTQQLLLYAGRGARAAVSIDLSALVREAEGRLVASIDPGARLALDLAPDLPLVEGDARQLQRVLANLVANAAEALDGGGAITLRTGMESLGEDDLAGLRFGRERMPGRYAYFEVADTGAGMTDDVRARAFEPFFTTRFTGRGVGLAAVAGVVRAHGGAIALRSAPGRGTMVRVYLPTTIESRTSAWTPPDVHAPAPSAATILVVDDDEAVRGVAHAMLAAQGFAVETVADGPSALTVLAGGKRVDLILLDLTMPGMSGHEVLAALARSGREVPVLLMSGYAVDARDEGLIYAGLRGFVHKPFRVADLVGAVSRALAAGPPGAP